MGANGRRIDASTRGGGGMNMYPEFVGEMIEYKPKVESVGSQRLETSALGLTFAVKAKYVNLGLKLECTASIGSVYWQSFQETPKVSPREQPAVSGNWPWTSSPASSKYLFLQSSYKKCIQYIFAKHPIFCQFAVGIFPL